MQVLRWWPSAGSYSAMPAHRAAERARHVHARALRRGRGAPVAAPQAHRGRKLGGDEVELGARAAGALGVVEGLGLLQLLLEVAYPLPVLGLRVGVEQRAGVVIAARPDRQLAADAPRGGRARAGPSDQLEGVDSRPG